MPRKKKESLADLKEETQEKVVEAAEKAEDVVGNAVDTVERAVEEVRKEKRVMSLLKKIRSTRFALFALTFLAVVGLSASGYFYYQYTQTRQVLGSAQNQPLEAQELVDKVGKLMELPQEELTIATVSDVEKLRNQPFFEKAQNGDKVLIYKASRKAILFRPETNKIIDVATVDLDDPAASQPDATPTPEAPQGPFSVVIWNGTTTAGLTLKGEAAIEDIEDIEVAERDNAQGRDYEDTIVVAIGDVPEEKVDEIASKLNAGIESLPSDEEAPDGDILIILGRDFVTPSPSVEE